MDEPFSAIDAINRMTLQKYLVDAWLAEPRTVIYVTHDIDEAVYLADRIAIMTPSPGRIGQYVTVDMPRPRDRNSARATELRSELTDIMRQVLEATERQEQGHEKRQSKNRPAVSLAPSSQRRASREPRIPCASACCIPISRPSFTPSPRRPAPMNGTISTSIETKFKSGPDRRKASSSFGARRLDFYMGGAPEVPRLQFPPDRRRTPAAARGGQRRQSGSHEPGAQQQAAAQGHR